MLISEERKVGTLVGKQEVRRYLLGVPEVQCEGTQDTGGRSLGSFERRYRRP